MDTVIPSCFFSLDTVCTLLFRTGATVGVDGKIVVPLLRPSVHHHHAVRLREICALKLNVSSVSLCVKGKHIRVAI